MVDKKLLKVLLATPNLRFLWPLWEGSGVVAHDYSGAGLNGAISSVTLGQPGQNARVPVLGKFDGLNDKIVPAAGCTVRGLSAVTFLCVTEIVDASGIQAFWHESTADSTAYGRLQIRLEADEKFRVYALSRLSTQAFSYALSTSPLPLGLCILHAVVDVGTPSIRLYRNGAMLPASTAYNFQGDATFADTAPANLQMGYCYPGAERWYRGSAGYIGQYARALTPVEILTHAQVGGFV